MSGSRPDHDNRILRPGAKRATGDGDAGEAATPNGLPPSVWTSNSVWFYSAEIQLAMAIMAETDEPLPADLRKKILADAEAFFSKRPRD